MIPLGQIDWLVKNGFVVVAYNYRLCPNVSYMDGPIGDSREVYHWSRTKLPGLMKNDIGLDVDGERVVVFGGSAGGTITMALVSTMRSFSPYELLADPIRATNRPGQKLSSTSTAHSTSTTNSGHNRLIYHCPTSTPPS